MSFLYPEFLYYMLPPLFVLFGLLLTQKESQADFFSDEVIKKLRVSSNTLTMQARNGLFLLAGFFIIISLANPVINDGEVEVKAKSSDIMIALDISDSMLGEDLYPNRLKFAKQKATELLKLGSDERVGVVAFAKNSYLVSPLSFDHDAVRFLLTSLNTDSITQKGTDMMTLLKVVSNSSKNKQKHLLILTDGGDSDDFSDEIEFAKENNIIVFVLAVGSKKGVPIKLKNGEFIKYKGDIIISKLNENISKLATKTGGVYIESVNSNEDIKTMLSEIKSKTKAKELKSEKVKKYIPLFYYPLGLSLLILLIAMSSMSKRVSVDVPSIFVMFSLVFITPDAKASIFDFMEIDKAKKAYEDGKYKESAKIYEEYAKSSDNAQGYFNSANSYYKQKDYDKAIQLYKKSYPENDDLAAKKLANLGNAYVKRAKDKDLKKALDSYEKSLKLKDDKEVKENYEAVKKALEDKKKKNKQDKQQDKQNQDNKDKQNSKDSDNSDSSKKDDKGQKEEDKQNSKNSDKSKDSKEQNKEEAKKEKREQDESSKDAKSSQDKQKDENQTDNQKLNESQNSQQSKDEMSEVEVKKWIQQLNDKPNTYMYQLNKENTKQENENEKPW